MCQLVAEDIIEMSRMCVKDQLSEPHGLTVKNCKPIDWAEHNITV